MSKPNSELITKRSELSRTMSFTEMDTNLEQLKLVIDQSNDNLDIRLRQNMKRLAAEAGFNLVDGSFEEGATLNSSTDVIWWKASGKYYQWAGAFPRVVAANTVPADYGVVGVDWVDVTDTSLRSDLASQNGGKSIGYSGRKNTITAAIDYMFLDTPVYVIDYLPSDYVTDGSVNYIAQVQQAITDSVMLGVACVFPPFVIGIDVSTLSVVNSLKSGLQIPTGAKVYNAQIEQFATQYAGYAIMYLDDVNNIKLKNIRITGDKYIHTGTDGEHGMGISVRGNTYDVDMEDICVSSCWGDGVYFGSMDLASTENPRNINVRRLICDKNRRNGISVVALTDSFFEDVTCTNTKSSDSPVTLAIGPHAGIDIEPNSFYNKTRGLKFRNVSGGGNDSGLLNMYFGATTVNNDTSSTYEINISFDGLDDNGSLGALRNFGLAVSMTNYKGAININGFRSTNAQGNPIYIADWFYQNNVQLNIKDVNISNWLNSPSLTNIQAVPIALNCSESGNTYPSTTYPLQGNILIDNIIMSHTSSDLSAHPYAVLTVANNGFKNTAINIRSIHTTTPLSCRVFGTILNETKNQFGLGATKVVTDNLTLDVAENCDYLISATLAITLPTSIQTRAIDSIYRFKVTAENDTTFLRLICTSVPMYVNGTLSTAANFYRKAGIVTVKFTNWGVIVNAEGLVSSFT